jgi:hypothetical protein
MFAWSGGGVKVEEFDVARASQVRSDSACGEGCCLFVTSRAQPRDNSLVFSRPTADRTKC